MQRSTAIRRQRVASSKPDSGNLPIPKKQIGAEQIISWIEKHCYVPEGKFVGQKVKLRDWQKDELRRIYDNPHGTRRAIISFGRKNAKTTLAAYILLVHLVGYKAVPNGQLYSTAQSREQAGIIFDLAQKVVRMSPTLSEAVIIQDTAKQLRGIGIGTKYKALSADVATSYGLSPALVVHDELGQVRGPSSELYDALETAMSAQENPLSIIISTQAPTEGDLLSILIDDALAEHDPRTVVSLYTAPIDAPPFSEETIKLANPAYGDFQNKDVILEMAETAKRLPSSEASYRNLVLNQRVEASNPFITQTVWETCNKEPLKDFAKLPVYGGLDLSATNDLTALVLITESEKIWQVQPTFWLPADGIKERSRLDRVPYDVWARENKLMLSPGKTVEYEFVAKYLAEIFTKYNVQKIAFDRWGFKHLRPWLIKAGLPDKLIAEKFVEFGQGFASMSPALRTLEGMILNGRLAHGGHSVLNMCAWNSVVYTDPAGNRKLDKSRSRGRIDGMVALVMAAAVAEATPQTEKKEYQMIFV